MNVFAEGDMVKVERRGSEEDYADGGLEPRYEIGFRVVRSLDMNQILIQNVENAKDVRVVEPSSIWLMHDQEAAPVDEDDEHREFEVDKIYARQTRDRERGFIVTWKSFRGKKWIKWVPEHILQENAPVKLREFLNLERGALAVIDRAAEQAGDQAEMEREGEKERERREGQ